MSPGVDLRVVFFYDKAINRHPFLLLITDVCLITGDADPVELRVSTDIHPMTGKLV